MSAGKEYFYRYIDKVVGDLGVERFSRLYRGREKVVLVASVKIGILGLPIDSVCN